MANGRVQTQRHGEEQAWKCVQGSTQGHWRFPEEGYEQGLVYLMTHPGTPCLFYDDLLEPKKKALIQKLVALRQKAGISCRSEVGFLEHQVLVSLKCWLLHALPSSCLLAHIATAANCLRHGSVLGCGQYIRLNEYIDLHRKGAICRSKLICELL